MGGIISNREIEPTKNTEERMILPLLSLLNSSPKLSVSQIRFGLADSHINSLSLTDDYHLAFGTGDGTNKGRNLFEPCLLCRTKAAVSGYDFILVGCVFQRSNSNENVVLKKFIWYNKNY